MPYFVYRVSADRNTLTEVEVFDKFKPAKDLCRDMRKSQAPDDTDSVRMIFAEDKKMAEGLMKAKNQPSSPLEEWEA